jgi:hypothetical protein
MHFKKLKTAFGCTFVLRGGLNRNTVIIYLYKKDTYEDKDNEIINFYYAHIYSIRKEAATSKKKSCIPCSHKYKQDACSGSF